MSDIVLHDVNDGLTTELGKPGANHHSPEDEARSLRSDVLLTPPGQGWSQVEAIYDRLTNAGRQFEDSAALIREDRNR
jgi:hypothetical protein